jgi:hypothetical protein
VTPVLLYLCNEADNGIAPASIADSAAGTAVNLTPTYGTGGGAANAAWTSIGAGRGLSTGTHAGNDATGTALRSGALNGSKVATAFNAATKVTWEFVINVPAGAATNGGTVLDVSDSTWTNTALGGIYKAASSHTWEIYRPGGVLAYTVPMPTAGTTTVVQIAIDTTQATPANRIAIDYSATPQTVTTVSAIPQNTTWTVGTEFLFICGAPPTGTPIDWVTTCTLYFFALYADTMGSVERAAHSTSLLANNDADPNAGGGGGGGTTHRRGLLGVGKHKPDSPRWERRPGSRIYSMAA